jgi:creatinine amidohydrolase/Fe(II)-dependent formamide hydrolase-like protein
MIRWRSFTENQVGALSLAEDVREAPFFAILPVGATEQYGLIIPLGIDWIVACEMK